ncbi:hypothetical protein V5E97_06540 [Singulisphaera sp. Ch08]|uniref:Uncharacterized protein n=1 Tax=Singulisphaera sp. Ch08 TaxID=3120278 RepID=A0AAU7CKX1_9BACT
MAISSRIRSSLALFLLAGPSIFGCSSEPPPPEATPAVASPAADTGPPSGAAADAARARSARK